jgi:hypothetical protein
MTAIFLAIVMIVGETTAWARRVGFVNLAEDNAAGQRAIADLRPRVTRQARLSALGPGAARDALEGPMPLGGSDEELALGRTQPMVVAAQTALKAFDSKAALAQLGLAEAALRGLTPTPPVIDAYYQLQLVLGQARFADGDEAGARAAFAVARRLRPGETALDPARYRPRLVQLYDEAGTVPTATGTLHVTSEPPGATVWLDGKAIAVTPADVPQVSVGEHLLSASLDGHEARTERVTVVAGASVEQAFLLSRLPGEQRARALRRALFDSPDPAALAVAARALVDVAAVDVLVIVRDRAGGGLEAAAWESRNDELGDWVPGPGDVVRLVAAVQRDAPSAEDAARLVPPPPPPTVTRWYQTWWGVSLLVGGGLVLTGLAVALTIPRDGGTTTTTLIIGDPVWSEP